MATVNPLERHAQNLLGAVLDWQTTHPVDRQNLESALAITWSAIVSMTSHQKLPEPALHRLMMWQTARLYQIQGLVLILGQQLDGGMALLRMATELTRDIVFIGDDSKRLEIWLKRTDPETKKLYRKSFRFDESDPLMKYVKHTYDLTSEWGVHSHLTAASHLGVTAEAAGVVRLEVDREAIERSYTVWACAFVPIQLSCINTFLPAFDSTIRYEYNKLRTVGDLLCRRAQ